jgi:hypothetical protein
MKAQLLELRDLVKTFPGLWASGVERKFHLSKDARRDGVATICQGRYFPSPFFRGRVRVGALLF